MQLLNAYVEIVLRVLGNVAVLRLKQFSNARSPMYDTPSGISRLEREQKLEQRHKGIRVTFRRKTTRVTRRMFLGYAVCALPRTTRSEVLTFSEIDFSTSTFHWRETDIIDINVFTGM